ncbi:hypothetical protein N9937_00115 [bacterium]|nr:hypothetical protein [bacterium]
MTLDQALTNTFQTARVLRNARNTAYGNNNVPVSESKEVAEQDAKAYTANLKRSSLNFAL